MWDSLPILLWSFSSLISNTLLIPLLTYYLITKSKPKSKLPPGPQGVPFISNILWLCKSTLQKEATLRAIRTQFGPIVTLPFGIWSRPLILIFSKSLAYQTLVQNGAVFADRPEPLPTTSILSSNQHDINSAGYGPTWRLLRRNLTSQILHPNRIKYFSTARKRVLNILVDRLRLSSSHAGVIKLMDHIRFSMFSLLVLMCFGESLNEDQIKQIEDVQRKVLTSFNRFLILNIWPRLTQIILRGLWNELFSLKKKQEDVLIPHISARKGLNLATCYVDTLLGIELEDEDDAYGKAKRKLSEVEMMSACSEFLNAGTDTTSTTLEWIMGNLVKYPNIQAKLYSEIKGVIAGEAEHVEEDSLSKMPYLKAVVLEGLRRHPPAHFVLPHAVTREVELDGCIVPKNAVINFTIAEMGWDPEVWEDPMDFNPERFMSGQEEFDITGSREIKMMPFGVGRRICPGSGLALLHLEYFIANLVWKFEWAAVEGHDVDLSEKQEFTVVMKNPLHARISPRRNKKPWFFEHLGKIVYFQSP